MPPDIIGGALRGADPDLSFEGLPHYAPWGEIGRAVLYLASSVFFGLLLSLLYLGVTQPLRSTAYLAAPGDRTLSQLVISLLIQAFIAWMVIDRARYLGGGDLERGVGGYPIRRIGPIVWIGLGQAALTFLFMVLLWQWPAFQGSLQRGSLGGLLTAAVKAGLLPLCALVVNMVFLGPIWEELLFRGWLWTALRRSWGVWPAAVCTAVPWAVLHLGYGWSKLILMIPPAVILSFVRHKSGSVRATIVVHIVNNAAGVVAGLALS